MDRRHTLRLSLALNAILVVSAWLGFWFLTSGGNTRLAQLCSSSNLRILGIEPLPEEAASGHAGSPGEKGKAPEVSVATPERGCGICEAGEYGRGLCEEYGSDVVARTMAFTSGNTRLRRVLAKWRAGKPVRLGVIGGSNSAGQGVWDDNKMQYSKLNMHVRLFNYLDSLFPQSGGSVMERTGSEVENSFVNSAQFGKGTEYFVMCSEVHLPEDLDLIVVEFAVNDQNSQEALENYEFLIRYLLERPGSPAVLEFQTFGYEFNTIISGDGSHLATDLYYNIPTIAPRTLFYDQAQNNVTKFWDWWYWYNPHERPLDLSGVDLRHFGPGGHRVSAELMGAYIDQQLCQMKQIEAEAGHSDIDKLYPVQQIPQLSLLSTFSRENYNASIPKVQPACQSIDSDTHPLKPISSTGWDKWTWRNDQTGKEKHYLRATKPGSKVTFQLPYVTTRIDIYYLRSKSFGLGSIKCWLDGGDREQVIEGYWDREENIGQKSWWKDVEKGEHTMTCELLEADAHGGHEFRIISVMSF